MEDLIKLLNTAEEHLAEAKLALDKVDVSEVTGFLSRFQLLMIANRKLAEDLRGKKTALFEGLLDTMRRFTKLNKYTLKLADDRKVEFAEDDGRRLILKQKPEQSLFTRTQPCGDEPNFLNHISNSVIFWEVTRHCFAVVEEHLAHVAGDHCLKHESEQFSQNVSGLLAKLKTLVQ